MESLIQKFEKDVILHNKDIKYKVYNLTITFNPNCYSLVETWSDKTMNKIIDLIGSYSRLYFIIKESQQNHYCHYHGQIYMVEDKAKTLYKRMAKEFGRCKLVRNIKEEKLDFLNITSFTNKDYSSYTRYCLKDYEDNCKKIKDRKLLYVVDDLEKGNKCYQRLSTDFQ